MDRDARVETLVEQILDSGLAPEEACRDAPELLGAVRKQLAQVRLTMAYVAEVFPPAENAADERQARQRRARARPEIPGYELL